MDKESYGTRSANRARAILEQYAKDTGLDWPDEVQPALQGILTDLRHLCDAEAIAFYTAVEESYTYYLEERGRDKRKRENP